MGRKRKQESTYASYSKKQMISILQKDKCWESRRGNESDYAICTLHGFEQWEHDNMERIVIKKEHAKLILDRIEEIDYYIITIEYWEENELKYDLLERKNYHIHFMVKLKDDYQGMNKMGWYLWYKKYFEKIWTKADNNIDSTFFMTNKAKYAIPYLVTYMYKRDYLFKPEYHGNIDMNFIERMLKEHKNNPIEYQVDFGCLMPEGINWDIQGMSQRAIDFVNHMFIKEDLTWKYINDRRGRQLFFIKNGRFIHKDCFIDALGNCYQDYFRLFKLAKGILCQPDRFLVKFKAF